MKRGRSRPSGRQGITLIELLIAMTVSAILVGVIVQAFIVSTRTMDRESKQSDVHFAAERSVQALSRDASEAFAILTTFSVPSTSGWSDSGRSYVTTAGSDNGGTPEDDRFTTIFLLPSLERVGSDTRVVLDASGKNVGAYDAIVWTFTETTGKSAPHERRYDIRRACYPAAALASTSYTYNSGDNTVTIGTRTCTLERKYASSVVATDIIQASDDEAGWNGSGQEPLGRQARSAVRLRNREGQIIGQSPSGTSGGEFHASFSPFSHTAALSADELAALPFLRGTSNRVSVSDASLADFRVAAWQQGRADYSGQENRMARVSIYTSTNNRLRNKRDWR